MARASNSFGALFDMWQPAMQTWMMLAEAQTIMGMRLLGMAGLWPVATSENQRMVDEKGSAWLASALAGQQAMLRLATPAEVSLAMVRPVRRVTKANARRLSRRVLR